MEIKQASLKDFDEIIKLKLESKEEERDFNRNLKPVEDVKMHYEKYLRNDLSSEWRVVFIAEEEGTIVGLVVGKIYRTLKIAGYERSGYISNVYVKKKSRRKGIGLKLVEKVVEWFKQKGATNITLELYKDNDAAVNLYQRLGFKEHTIIMKKGDLDQEAQPELLPSATLGRAL